MALMRTSVKFCRCPCSFLYCFFRFRWKTRILLPRPSPSTSAVTLAVAGLARLPGSPETASTSLNSTVLSSEITLSICTTPPGATRYCLPPVRITAYITNPPALWSQNEAHSKSDSSCCIGAHTESDCQGQADRTHATLASGEQGTTLQRQRGASPNSTILSLNCDSGQLAPRRRHDAAAGQPWVLPAIWKPLRTIIAKGNGLSPQIEWRRHEYTVNSCRRS